LASRAIDPTDSSPLMLFFEDEAKFGRMNHVRKSWIEKTHRPIVKKQAIREYLYAFTAVCPQTGETCSIISPFCNTEAMNALLSEAELAFPEYRILMAMDSAGWHTTHSLIIPSNISILPLPPYSPELNPTEHIWDYIREQKNFNNFRFNSLDDVDFHLGNALNDLLNEKETMKSMCSFHWIYSDAC